MSTVSTLDTLEPFRRLTIHTLLGLLSSTGPEQLARGTRLCDVVRYSHGVPENALRTGALTSTTFRP